MLCRNPPDSTLDLDDKVPHYATLENSNAKLLNDAMLRKLLKQTLEQFYRYPKHAQIDDDDMTWIQCIGGDKGTVPIGGDKGTVPINPDYIASSSSHRL